MHDPMLFEAMYETVRFFGFLAFNALMLGAIYVTVRQYW